MRSPDMLSPCRLPQARFLPTAITAGLQATLNLLIVVLYTLLAMVSYVQFVHFGTVRIFGVLAVNTLFLALFLARKPAMAETSSPALWLLAFAGSALPLVLRPTNASAHTALGASIQVVGLGLLIAALLSLRRSFAVVPANRGVRDGGMYRLVRHPVYLSELITVLGIVLANPSALNAAIWVCECALQLARARAEERFLSADPLYSAYCARVRYRLIPWVA